MFALAFAGFGCAAFEYTIHKYEVIFFTICLHWLSLALAGWPMKTQNIEDVDEHDFPEVILFYNMSALAFAGFGWLAYENVTQ